MDNKYVAILLLAVLIIGMFFGATITAKINIGTPTNDIVSSSVFIESKTITDDDITIITGTNNRTYPGEKSFKFYIPFDSEKNESGMPVCAMR